MCPTGKHPSRRWFIGYEYQEECIAFKILLCCLCVAVISYNIIKVFKCI